jgi:hypothetical protein
MDTWALTVVQFAKSVVCSSTTDTGLVAHSRVCEFTENRVIRMAGGPGTKFATRERFKVTENW